MIIDCEPALRAALQADSEDEHLEFKAAQRSFDFDKLASYCAALSNEGGGHIVLGVTDRKPRQIIGTSAFPNIGDTKARLLNRLHKRVEVTEITTASGRVLVFRAPPAAPGHPVDLDGRYLMRVGEQLVSMTGDHLKEFFRDDIGDLSATTVNVCGTWLRMGSSSGHPVAA